MKPRRGNLTKVRPYGRVALVTGGAHRLGRAIVEALAGDGWSVAVNYKRSGNEAKELLTSLKKRGSTAISVRGDVSRRSDVARIVSTVRERFGRIDLLVNNAGIFFETPFLTTSEEEWDRILAVNTKGIFLLSQAVSRVMLKQGGGKIINITSAGGLQAWPGYTPYSVSKAGAIMLTRCMAKALAPKITVNAIAPGTIEMDGDDTGAFIPLERIPLGRYGTPDDITSLVLYLANSSSYLTGQIIAVDGGRTIS